MKIKMALIGATAFVFLACGSRKKIVKTKGIILKTNQRKQPGTPQINSVKRWRTSSKMIELYTLQYIRKFSQIAVQEMIDYKIPASITLAQGLLESGNGRSKLALKSNNHFGIKCHKNWRGERVYHDDDKKNECFRKYKSPITSYKDHSIFLASKKRYARLFKLKLTDYKGWAKGLRKAGYATDRRYPRKLINLIERYQLYKFDVLEQNKNKTRQKSYTVKKGDTLYSIAKRFDTTVQKLMKLNALGDTKISIGQELLYK